MSSGKSDRQSQSDVPPHLSLQLKPLAEKEAVYDRKNKRAYRK